MLIVTFVASSAAAQEPVAPDPPPFSGDSAFPRPRSASVTLGSGIPFPVIGEVAYGVTRGFAIGVSGGMIPSEPAVGTRVRFRIPITEDVGVVLWAPLLFYPRPAGKRQEPWLVFRPSLGVAAPVSRRVGLAAGVGLLFAACLDDLRVRHRHEHDHGQPSMADVWYTYHLAMDVGVGQHLHLLVHAELIMDGARLARFDRDDLLAGIPALTMVGATWAF